MTQNDTIYLDNNSTTSLDPTVVDAMLPYFTTRFGNPSNPAHDYGLEAARAIEHAQSRSAHLIGSEAKEILFTSGGPRVTTSLFWEPLAQVVAGGTISSRPPLSTRRFSTPASNSNVKT